MDEGIVITDRIEFLTADQLRGGFFEGWPNPPRPEDHLRLLHGSYAAFVAMMDDEVVGFITAISDGVLTAFIPLLEVLPEHRGHGIGARLVHAMMERLSSHYSIDLVCDERVKPYYGKLGFREASAMVVRNYANQAGF